MCVGGGGMGTLKLQVFFCMSRLFLHRVRNLYYMFKAVLGQCRIYRSLDISAHNNIGPCQFRPITKSAYTISAHRYNNVQLVCLSIIGIIRSAYLLLSTQT